MLQYLFNALASVFDALCQYVRLIDEDTIIVWYFLITFYHLLLDSCFSTVDLLGYKVYIVVNVFVL